MKLILAPIICFFTLNLSAQKKIENKINEVKELNIYGKDASVIIGKIIVNMNSEPPSIKLLESFQSKNTDGSYITGFAFGNNSVTPLYNVDLKLKFSSPIDSLTEKGLIHSIEIPGKHGVSKDRLSYIFQSNEIVCFVNKKTAFLIFVKSKDKIETTITGAGTN